jgi:soluble lytic murein transglycosylase-like protein
MGVLTSFIVTDRVEAQRPLGAAPHGASEQEAAAMPADRLLAETRVFLETWQHILLGRLVWNPDQIARLLQQARALRSRAQSGAVLSLAHQLTSCEQCLTPAQVDRARLVQCLRNLSEVAWQLRREHEKVRASAKPAEPPELALTPPAPQVLPAELALTPPAPQVLPAELALTPPAPQVLPAELAPSPLAPAVLPAGLGLTPPAPPVLPAALVRTPPAPPVLPAALVRTPPAPPVLPAALAPTPSASSDLPAPVATAVPVAATEPAVPAADASARPRDLAEDEPALPEERPSLTPLPALPDDPPSLAALLELGARTVGREESERPGAERIAEIDGIPISVPPGPANEPILPVLPALPVPPALQLPLGIEAPFRVAESPPAEPDVEALAGAPFGASLLGAGRTARSVSRLRFWSGLVAVGVVGGAIALMLTLDPSRGRSASGQPSAAELAAAAERSALQNPLLSGGDDGVRALLSQVHARWPVESPELAAVLDEEASQLRRAAALPCATIGCRPENPAHQLLALRGLDLTETAGESGKWLLPLRLPGIGIRADSRGHGLLVFHTENNIGRERFQIELLQCNPYQASFQRALSLQGVPNDLMAVAMVASACESDAESPLGARGLWQLSVLTAHAYQLQVVPDSIDERLNPEKSTRAAARFLADLYRKTGSWDLAVAGFAAGSFELLARLARAGEKADLWQLASQDPVLSDAVHYVAKVQARALILANLEHFDFELPLLRALDDTVELEVPAGTRLSLVARAAGTTTTRIRELNPELIANAVPEKPDLPFRLRVPKRAAPRAAETLARLVSERDESDQCVPRSFDWGRQRFTRGMARRCEQSTP